MPSRERVSRAEAIVLRHMDWGEADRLLWLFTRETGKIRVVAKGVRKARSRKAGHLEPFTRVNLLLAQGRDLPIITQAEMIESHLPLHENLRTMGYAAYIVELLDRFTYEEGENVALYRLLDLVGFRPQLSQCVECGKPILPEGQFFSAAQGGLVCPKCSEKVPGLHAIHHN